MVAFRPVLAPVSYTHLDVYKRQLISLRGRFAGEAQGQCATIGGKQGEFQRQMVGLSLIHI